ncbi:MAG: tetratricopeptide repeat protein, partial [Treponema sp.]|nr:tetratricopeptide repeat protein [Treponema sp.]
AVLSFVDRNGVDNRYQDLYYDEELDGPEAAIPDEDGGMLYAVILPGINASISPAKAHGARAPAAMTGAAAPANTGTPQSPRTPQHADTPQHAAPPASVAPPPQYPTPPPQADSVPQYAPPPQTPRTPQYTAPPAGTAVPRTPANGTVLLEEAETRNKERNISSSSEQSAAALLSSPKPSRKKPAPLFRHIFSEDQTVPAGGDDYLLYEILQKSWMKYSYMEAKAALSTFLAQHRDEGTTNRALFYLAEAEYFTGNYDGALKLFLTVQDCFPQLAGKWIDSCIDLY